MMADGDRLPVSAEVQAERRARMKAAAASALEQTRLQALREAIYCFTDTVGRGSGLSDSGNNRSEDALAVDRSGTSEPLPGPPRLTQRPPETLSGEEALRLLEVRDTFLSGCSPVADLICDPGAGADLANCAPGWLRDGRIFSVNDCGVERYPLFQIKEGRPVPELAAILELLSVKLSGWQIAIWFVSPNAQVGSWRLPADILSVEPQTVLEAARHEVANAVC